MKKVELRKELHEYIDSADETVLETIYEILKQAENEDNFEISEELKRILDERVKAYYQNPEDVITWEEMKVRYGKK